MNSLKMKVDTEQLKYDQRGLITVVVQDIASGTVLMVAWANAEAVALTLETGRAHFFSRSRQQLWRKGETSGNELVVREFAADCDHDTLLLRVDPLGPTCHTGARSCFDVPQPGGDPEQAQPVASQFELGWLGKVLDQRAKAADADASYTARLLGSGLGRVAQKVGEEAVEVVIAAMEQNKDELVEESADLLFHWLVLMRASGIELEEVASTLRERHQASAVGSEEPA